jgi:hypothetical protein
MYFQGLAGCHSFEEGRITIGITIGIIEELKTRCLYPHMSQKSDRVALKAALKLAWNGFLEHFSVQANIPARNVDKPVHRHLFERDRCFMGKQRQARAFPTRIKDDGEGNPTDLLDAQNAARDARPVDDREPVGDLSCRSTGTQQ